MNRYKCKVIVRAQVEYEVEVEAYTETGAEREAFSKWKDMLPDDFRVNKGYVTEIDVDETTQLSWACHECDKDISEGEYDRCDEMCEECLAKEEARLAWLINHREARK